MGDALTMNVQVTYITSLHKRKNYSSDDCGTQINKLISETWAESDDGKQDEESLLHEQSSGPLLPAALLKGAATSLYTSVNMEIKWRVTIHT